jgi:crossover junction endonuclease MUS81
MIDLIIDNREKKLWNIIIDRDLDIYKDKINIQNKQLDIADIHIIINNHLYLFERKTINDLLASINDGRYREQKARLKSSNPHSITYIIEGDNIISSKNKNQNKLTSVYFNSIYRDGINVLFMKDIDETATFLLLLSTKMIDKPDNYIGTIKDKDIEYIDVCKIKTEKKMNIDKDNCYLLQLSQIPSISKELAKKIKEKYPSLLILMMTLKEEGDTILTKIDGIGKTKAKIIYDYLI